MKRALRQLHPLQWAIIGFFLFAALDIFVISRLLPFRIWEVWFSFKVTIAFCLPISMLAFLTVWRLK